MKRMVDISNNHMTNVRLDYDWADSAWCARAKRELDDDVFVKVVSFGETADIALRKLEQALKKQPVKEEDS